MNLNHFSISGNLTKDPELRSVGADKSVTTFTLAHNNRYKTPDGEMKEEATFIDCEAWGRQGEIVAQFLVKGSMTIVEGRIKQDSWTDKDGQKRSKLKLVADRVHLLPRVGVKEQSDDFSSNTNSTTNSTKSAASQPPGQTAQPATVRPSPSPARSTPRTATATAPSGLTDEPPF